MGINCLCVRLRLRNYDYRDVREHVTDHPMIDWFSCHVNCSTPCQKEQWHTSNGKARTGANDDVDYINNLAVNDINPNVHVFAHMQVRVRRPIANGSLICCQIDDSEDRRNELNAVVTHDTNSRTKQQMSSWMKPKQQFWHKCRALWQFDPFTVKINNNGIVCVTATNFSQRGGVIDADSNPWIKENERLITPPTGYLDGLHR